MRSILPPTGIDPKTPAGARVARWHCPESHTTFSLLPDCLAARLPGTLDDLEAVVVAAEDARSLEAAANALRVDCVFQRFRPGISLNPGRGFHYVAVGLERGPRFRHEPSRHRPGRRMVDGVYGVVSGRHSPRPPVGCRMTASASLLGDVRQ